MSWYKDFKLIPDENGYSLTIYLDANSTEFSKDFFNNVKEHVLDLDKDIEKFVKEKFPDMKINSVKLMLGALVIGSIPLISHSQVSAADVTTTVSQSEASSQLNTTGQVTSSKLNVRQGPSTSYSIIHVLWQNNTVKVIGESNGWYKIKLSDGREGWVSSSYLKLISTTPPSYTSLNTTGSVTSDKLNVREEANTTSSIIHVLWQGNTVKIIGESNGWYKIKLSDGREGWVSSSYLKLITQQTNDPIQQKVDIVIREAKALLGTPYVWGGESLQEGGFDCSGFTQYVFGKAGYTLNRISRDQATQGTTVSSANLKPGDLVFYSFEQNGIVSHVGIYLGNGQMIHSPKTGDVVKITDITTSYWKDRFVIAKRIIQ